MTPLERLIATLPPAPENTADDDSYCAACIALAWGVLGLPRLTAPEADRPADYSDGDAHAWFDGQVPRSAWDSLDLIDLLPNKEWVAAAALGIAAQAYARTVAADILGEEGGL